MEQTGDVLINIMADKTRCVAEIDAAFQMFCAKYELRLNRLVEVQCAKLGYSAEIAFKAVECAFARVRRYPTFDKMKTKVKNIDNAIVSWLNRIAYTQVLKFKNGNECAEVNTDEDLAVVNDAIGFYEVVSQRRYMSDEEKEEKIQWLNVKLAGMEDKHRIVLLTYLAYESQGKKLPRSLTLKLRTQLNLEQSSIRVYKKEALEALNINS